MSNAEEAEQFYEDLQDLLELTPKKDDLFIIGDLNAKVGNQKIAGITGKFGLGVQNEEGQRTKSTSKRMHWSYQTFSSNNSREDTKQTSPDGQHQNQIHYILCSQRWRGSIQSVKTRPGADCGSDHELLIAKFRIN